MNNDLITIIVAAYNHEKYIEESLAALMKQTYNNLELILIDDGSKDKTYEKVLEMKPLLEKRFVNLHIDKHENKGLILTQQELISYAKGKYIFSIASDDVAHEDAIEVLYNYLSQHDDYVCVVGDNEFIDSDSKPVCMDENKQIVSKKSFHSFKTFLEYAYVKYLYLFGKKLSGCNKMEDMDFIPYNLLWFSHFIPIGLLIRTDIMRKVTNYNINTPVDDIYMHYQLTKIGKLKVLSNVLIKYRLHNNQTINDKKHFEKVWRTRLYELYLLDTCYPEFKTGELKKSWWYMQHYEQWEKAKKSLYWDEEYYISKYPEVKREGWVPLIHYLTVGKDNKYLPSPYFESIFHPVFNHRNMLIKGNHYFWTGIKLQKRLKIMICSFLLLLGQIPIIDILINSKMRNNLIKKINSNWR